MGPIIFRRFMCTLSVVRKEKERRLFQEVLETKYQAFFQKVRIKIPEIVLVLRDDSVFMIVS